MSNNLPLIWKMFYIFSDTSFGGIFLNLCLELNSKKLKSYIQNYKPDYIFTTYYLSGLLGKISGIKFKLKVIVTDWFSLSKIWFLNKKAEYFVYSKKALLKAKKNRVLKVKNIHPICPLYFQDFSSEDNLEASQILILGGGDGLQNFQVALNAVVSLPKKILNKFRIKVICGRSRKMFREAKNLSQAYKEFDFEVEGFSNSVVQEIAKSKLVISKAGTNTVLEVLLQHKPLLMVSFIPGQETGTKEFVEKNKYGQYIPKSSELKEEIIKIVEGKPYAKFEIKKPFWTKEEFLV